MKEEKVKREYDKNYKFYAPIDTQKILNKNITKIKVMQYNERKKQWEVKEWYYQSSEFPKNPLLIFGKLIPQTSISDEEDENKDKYLQLVIFELNGLLTHTRVLEQLSNRIKHIMDNLQKEGFEVVSIHNLTCSWRLIIGLGASHPQETSMTLHHIYGIPYIPGSAIKGVTRHWAVLKFAEKFVGQRNEKGKFDGIIENVAKALEEGKDLNIAVDGVEFEDLIKIFGTQKRQGEVIFFDAYPTENINLKIDIMNPHYSKYYSGELPPADWQSPLLVKFLTVEDTKFQFYLAAKEEDLLKKASKLLKGALVDHGLGAKTSLGYGLFVETPHS